MDAEPTSDSAPPRLEFLSADFGRPVRVRVTDASGIADVELHARYVEWSGPDADSADDLFTGLRYRPTDVERVGPDSVVYTFRLDRGGQLNLPPAGYYVNATDTEGNEIDALVAVNNSTGQASAGGATVTSDGRAAAAIAAGAVGSTAGELATGAGSSLAAGAGTSVVLTGGAAILLVASVYVVVEFTPPREVPVQYTEGTAVGAATVQGGRYENLPPAGGQPATTAETPTGAEVVLMAGALYERQGHLRGWGLDYIALSSTISEADIKHAIRNANRVVRRNGEIDSIIGPGLSDKELLVISIIGGAVLVADSWQKVEDDICDETIYYRFDDLDEHVLSNPKKEIDRLQDVLKGIEEPLQIWIGNKFRYYLAFAEGKGYYIVKVASPSSLPPGIDLVIGTVLLFQERFFWDTLEGAIEQLEERQLDDPDNRWDGNEDNPNC